jgi:hypothetical protein
MLGVCVYVSMCECMWLSSVFYLTFLSLHAVLRLLSTNVFNSLSSNYYWGWNTGTMGQSHSFLGHFACSQQFLASLSYACAPCFPPRHWLHQTPRQWIQEDPQAQEDLGLEYGTENMTWLLRSWLSYSSIVKSILLLSISQRDVPIIFGNSVFTQGSMIEHKNVPHQSTQVSVFPFLGILTGFQRKLFSISETKT